MSENPVERNEDRPTAESFGTWLRQQREMREIDLKEIADRTKISARYLRAMEQDRFDLLPGPIFARGFLREYAKYVGLDPDEAVNYYLSTQQESEEGSEERVEEVEAPRGWRWGLVASLLGILGLAVISFFVSASLERGREGTGETLPPFGPPISEPAPVATAEPPAEAAEAEAAPLEVTVDFSEDCWVEAVLDGEERLEQRFVQGESLQLSAQESVEFLTLGNAGGVSLSVNGRPFDLGAASGQVLHGVTIDLEIARKLAAGES